MEEGLEVVLATVHSPHPLQWRAGGEGTVQPMVLKWRCREPSLCTGRVTSYDRILRHHHPSHDVITLIINPHHH